MDRCQRRCCHHPRARGSRNNYRLHKRKPAENGSLRPAHPVPARPRPALPKAALGPALHVQRLRPDPRLFQQNLWCAATLSAVGLQRSAQRYRAELWDGRIGPTPAPLRSCWRCVALAQLRARPRHPPAPHQERRPSRHPPDQHPYRPLLRCLRYFLHPEQRRRARPCAH